jgi:hypothetical protein
MNMDNTNDRELLELAAKAAGYQLDGLASKYVVQDVHLDSFLRLNEQGGHSTWNPLTDDCDALRLAVKLNLNLRFGASDSDFHPALIYADLPRSPYVSRKRDWLSVEFIPDDLLSSQNPETASYASYLIRNYPELVQGKNAATRRAIVRAAAEIGKALTKPAA